LTLVTGINNLAEIKEREKKMDYIPSQDTEFDPWVKTYVDYAVANHLALGLTVALKDALQAAYDLWMPAYQSHLSAQAAANSATQNKLSARASLETIVREATNLIQANTSVTNEQKAALGVTIRKETKTPTPVPTTRPMAEVDNRNRLEHTINFFDEATPSSKAKPAGVRACELWCKIGGAPPVDTTELTYLATDTKTPYIAHFDGTTAGQTVHYWLRWVNTRNEPGPWSETISVTISA
jgi:hypothetical protein